MDPLPQYGAYAFLPYPSPSSSPSYKIKHTSTYTYCGPLLTPSTLPRSLHPWLAQTTTSPPALLAQLLPLLTFLRDFLERAGCQHYWLSVRASTATSEYNQRRWHVDDDFFSCAPTFNREDTKTKKKTKTKKTNKHEEKTWKLTTTLTGPTTLLVPLPLNNRALDLLATTLATERAKNTHVCPSFRCPACSATSASTRTRLAAALTSLLARSGEGEIHAPRGAVIFLRVGGEQGAVHSEPRCDGGERVFVNVVPGSEEGLRVLMGRWGMEFPRAWRLGGPPSPLPLVGEDREDGYGGGCKTG